MHAFNISKHLGKHARPTTPHHPSELVAKYKAWSVDDYLRGSRDYVREVGGWRSVPAFEPLLWSRLASAAAAAAAAAPFRRPPRHPPPALHYLYTTNSNPHPLKSPTLYLPPSPSPPTHPTLPKP